MKKPIHKLAIAGSAVATLLLVGCSNGDTPEPAAPPAETTAPAPEATGDGLAELVASFLEPAGEYDMPSDGIDDASALEGKTIHYIPITLQAPIFSLTANVIDEAAAAIGASVHVCNGDGTPTAITECIDGARNDANTGAIVLDGFFIGMAANAAIAAQQEGHLVISNNQAVIDDFPSSETLGYVTSPGEQMYREIAMWSVVDSGGDGTILTMVSGDGPVQRTFVDNNKDELAEACADCTFLELDKSSANFAQAGSDLSAQLLQNPNIEYVLPQYAQFLPVVLPVVAGQDLKVGTTAATLGALQAVQSGQVAAASGQSAPFGAWAIIDAALRMANGQEVYNFDLPTRLFTADNIADVDVSEGAETSGEWFGPTDFPGQFKTLWGVQ